MLRRQRRARRLQGCRGCRGRGRGAIHGLPRHGHLRSPGGNRYREAHRGGAGLQEEARRRVCEGCREDRARTEDRRSRGPVPQAGQRQG